MDFTKGYSRHDLIYFLIPLIAAELFQQVYSLINTVVVSQVLDYQAVAVLGACSGFFSVRSDLICGMLYGFGIYMGKAVGSGDEKYFQRTFSAAFFGAVFLGMMGFMLIPFTKGMVTLGNIPEELSRDSVQYLQVAFAGCGTFAIKLLLLVTLQAIGETFFYSFLAVAGVMLNTGFVVLFIKILHGGVAYAALATLLTDLLLAVSLFVHIYRKRRSVLRMAGIGDIPSVIWSDLLKNGSAKTAYFMLGSIGSLFLQRAINTFSIEVIAGQTWAVRLQTILLAAPGELGTASGVITGQNVGAKRMDYVSLYHKKLLRVMVVLGVASIGVVYFAGLPILRFLSGAEQPAAVADAGIRWLRITVLAFPVLFFILYRNALQAMGRYPQVVGLGVMHLVWMFGTSYVLVPHFGLEAAAFGVAAGWLLQSIAGVYFFRHAVRGGNGVG